MQDELVQMASLVAEAGLAVAALLGRAEFVLEERVVLGADDGEVIRHLLLSSLSDSKSLVLVLGSLVFFFASPICDCS